MQLFHAYGDYAKLANAVVHRCRNWVGLSIASLPGKLAWNLLVPESQYSGQLSGQIWLRSSETWTSPYFLNHLLSYFLASYGHFLLSGKRKLKLAYVPTVYFCHVITEGLPISYSAVWCVFGQNSPAHCDCGVLELLWQWALSSRARLHCVT